MPQTSAMVRRTRPPAPPLPLAPSDTEPDLNEVGVIAADPAAGGKADGVVEAGDSDIAGDEAFLDIMGVGEFAFDGGVVFAELAGGPGGFGLGKLFDGQGR